MFLPYDLTKLEKFNDIPSDMISIKIKQRLSQKDNLCILFYTESDQLLYLSFNLSFGFFSYFISFWCCVVH